MRKINNILLTVSLLMAPVFALAWNGPVELGVRDAVIRKNCERLSVGFTAETGRFPRDYKVTLVPVLYDDSGKSVALEPLTLAGSRKMISDKRNRDVSGDRHVVKGRDNSQFSYTTEIQWEPWMQNVSLSVYRFGEGCHGGYEDVPVIVAEGRLIYKAEPIVEVVPEKPALPAVSALEEFRARNPFLHPAADYPDRFELLSGEQGDASVTVYFRVGRSELDPMYMDNHRELKSVYEAYRAILDDPSASLKKIFIAGFASPEGGLALNTELGQKRAEAVRDYLMRELEITDGSVFEIYNGRENWDGLRRMVEASYMPERDKVLYIIDSHSTGEEIRKDKLKYFAGGVPYSYMLQHFFPKLRSAGYVQIYYETNL